MYKKYDKDLINEIITEIDNGAKKKTLSKKYNIPRGTLSYWYKKDKIEPEFKIDLNEYLKDKKQEYSYILGIYLGDGTISRISGGYKIRIFLDSVYYNIVEECSNNLKILFPKNKVSIHKEKCNMYIITLYSNLLPKLFPQFGKGLKHNRNIILEKFQLDNINNIQLIKGLFHSDGSLYKAKIGKYEYFFYNFTNMSKDIIDIYCDALSDMNIKYKLNFNSDVYRVNIYKKVDFAKLYYLIGTKNVEQEIEIYNYIKTKEKITKEKTTKTTNHCKCGKEINKRSSMCEECFKKSIRKVKERPSKNDLIYELSTSNYTAVGKKYGVSDNTIRKWLK